MASENDVQESHDVSEDVAMEECDEEDEGSDGEDILHDKYSQERGTLIKPVEKIVGESIKSKTDSTSGRVYQQQRSDTYQYVPIEKLIKAHLEQKGIMELILEQEQLHNSSLLETYRDGNYYKEKVHQENKTLIPLLLYNDDTEVGNPLGFKKGFNKLSMFYVSLLCSPARYQASLSNILLAACAKTSVIAQYGIDTALSALLEDLKKLEMTGIEIHCDAYSGVVTPVLFQVIGDNLGLHQMLGFVLQLQCKLSLPLLQG
ncbi:hypothetical protein HOLleu_00039 [Holothuria leucospilota]|uniref:Uncharacterized protein n=1 Tax=Holothuria leucospilota TaxID=206669 RepID=A0A9Q1CN12_HOLLE|nr:hypothetical protein HOLleu_00039 [Holothuria leucospilota]